MQQWETLDVVERDSNKVSGTWVFRGTRVPVSALFENLRDGATIEEFVEWFPGVWPRIRLRVAEIQEAVDKIKASDYKELMI